jgi:hypothetical protein
MKLVSKTAMMLAAGAAIATTGLSLPATAMADHARPSPPIAPHAAPQAAPQAATMPSPDMPPQARPGQCFARVVVPATYSETPVEIVTGDAYERVDADPAVFQSRVEAVETSPEHKRYVVTEPTFREEAHTIVTRPAYERLVARPVALGTRAETVVIREPRLVWRRGTDLSGVRRLDPTTGEVYCLVEEQAVTRQVARRVVVEPGRVHRETVPQETRTIRRKVLVTPASVREELVRATTTPVTIHELVRPAAERRTHVPETRGTINRQVLATPERHEWVEVVCDNAATPARVPVSAAQRALARKGHYHGPIDGIVGPRTTEAARRFQRAQGLPGDGALTVETLRALGL